MPARIFASVAVFFLLVCLLYTVRLIHNEYLKKYILRQRSIIYAQLILVGVNLNPSVISVLAPFGVLAIAPIKLYRIRREKKIEQQLPDAMILISNAIKAGLAISQAIEITTSEMKNPIKHEFEIVAKNLRSGSSVDDALAEFEKRIRSKDIEIFVESVSILRRAGGNIVETLSLLAATINERRQVAKKNDAAVAQCKYQAYILSIMPWAITLMIWLISPGYIEPLIFTRLGMAIALFGVSIEMLGFIWMMKMVRVRI